MGWLLTGLGVALVTVIVAGAALALYRRYCVTRHWSARNVWNACEECRQKFFWLWAPREEKVGLVKAQHPTAQTIPGLYRQTGNPSQHLLHSDSDLRLDAQGAFTRFEPVDRDLHPPLDTSNTIPPQPLRPAPQPRPTVRSRPTAQPRQTARPRPPPLQASKTVDYLRMQEAGPGPLTPPPTLQRAPPPRTSGASVFLFQSDAVNNYGLHEPPNDHSPFRFEGESAQTMAESIQMTPLARYGVENVEKTNVESFDGMINPYRQFYADVESTRIRYGVNGVPITKMDENTETEDVTTSYGSYDIVQRSHIIRQHVRNDSRGSASSFGMANFSNANQTIMESIYGPDALSKMFQTAQSLGNDLDHKSNGMQGIEMTPLRSSTFQNDIGPSYMFRNSVHRVPQYTQSLPDISGYEPIKDDTMRESINELKVSSESAANTVPPPPAPPDPAKESLTKNGPTTGERIFSAARSIASESYIDASEFYNSVFSSAEQEFQRFNFPSPSSSLVENSINNGLQEDVQHIYEKHDAETIGSDVSRQSSDLYCYKLNLEAHRTARKVYNSLQDPPSSPLLLKDHDFDMYTFMNDPSFRRTSEDIYNSLQRRTSMERLNGIHGLNDVEGSIMEQSYEVQVNDNLSESLDESYIMSYVMNDNSDVNSGSRGLSQAPEPEPPPDETGLSLKKTLSSERLCPDTSAELNQHQETAVVGSVWVAIEYERWGRGTDTESDLIVSILEARDLFSAEGLPAEDTFARVCLLPDRQKYRETRIYRGSQSPSYQEKFTFSLDGGPTGRTLFVEIFSDESSMGGGASLIGEASLNLGPAPRVPATTRLQLTSPIAPTLGELMFSLSYLPTAERLTVVVVKARNLRRSNATSGEYFVKAYLLQGEKKTCKKNTSVKRAENSPIFNESLSFNVSTIILQNIQLRLTVAEVTADQGTNSKPHSLGHVIVGPKSTGRALAHWRQMLVAQRRPVSMWHALRK